MQTVIKILILSFFCSLSYGQIPPMFIGTGAASAPTCQTFDASHKGSNVALSNSDKTYSTIVATGLGGTCGTVNKTSGDWYIEYTCTTKGTGTTLGIVTSNTSFNTGGYIGSDVYGYAYYSNFGGFYNNGSPNFFTFSDNYTDGDVIGIAIHIAGASSTFKAYKNNTLEGTQTINISSIYSAGASTTGAGTLNLPTSTYSPPSGYTLLCN